MEYSLNLHSQELLDQFRQNLPVYKKMEQVVVQTIQQIISEQGIPLSGIEHRVKAEKSLAGKLELKGGKYASISDITDLFGMRIITFYTDDVDKVAAIVKRTFSVDWNESVDKRKLHDLTSFGYNSLHYICRIPETLACDPNMPQLNEFRFEIQMRTGLQHVWSTIEHDIGYKGSVKILPEYRRQFGRLAGMLELIDDEFSRLRTAMTDYRRQMQSLVASGKLDEVPLNESTFRSYLEMNPFRKLNERIAASNQAEILPYPLMSFLRVLEHFDLKTLGDVQRFVDEDSDAAYQLALSQLAFTDIDIISESIGLQHLCIVRTLKMGLGQDGIRFVFDTLNGCQAENKAMAKVMFKQAAILPFMQNNEK